MNRERTKTLILSLLVILSIMSVHKIWFDSPLPLLQTDATGGKEYQAKVYDLRNQVISPKRATVGFGGGTRNDPYAIPYTILDYYEMKDVWEISKLLLLDFFAGEVEIESIGIDQYLDNNRRRFVELEFGDNISSVILSSLFEVVDSRIIRNVREIKKIFIPVNNVGRIYLVGNDDNIYEVRLNNYQNDMLEGSILELERKEFVRYYPTLNYVGNQTLIPVNYDQPLHSIVIESEINSNNESDVIARTKSLFNDNFDFVKTIQETSGSRIFLYGYGEKSVRVSNRGHLEFKQEVGNASSTNVTEALNVALGFIDGHGGLPETAYIDKIENVAESNKGYYFSFGYSVGGYPIAIGDDIPPIEIEIFGNKVKTYRRIIRNELNPASFDMGEGIISPINIIEKHLELLKKDFIEDSITVDKIDDNEILSSISNVEIVYHDPLEIGGMQLLTPNWRITVNNRVYYFDGYSGSLLYNYNYTAN
ncbi:two-component system activity regulator YycH [Alkaliphilus transvaalensis]|uniref:two-component system activity regulator YycH n=1 Tax=Alkaliphilus transvaalensis TaxID=114628 RepID=UPI0004798484|nr:two-component system activity regulator YycH [Alkaliphilus transvaalensis]